MTRNGLVRIATFMGIWLVGGLLLSRIVGQYSGVVGMAAALLWLWWIWGQDEKREACKRSR